MPILKKKLHNSFIWEKYTSLDHDLAAKKLYERKRVKRKALEKLRAEEDAKNKKIREELQLHLSGN